MKFLRPFLLAILLVVAFYFVTTRLGGPAGPCGRNRFTATLETVSRCCLFEECGLYIRLFSGVPTK